MNTVTPINKAPRLTEEEVHAAANELKEAGGKITTTEVYKHLGRGSLTTITNYLKTWSQADKEETTALPALIALPEEMKTAAEQLAIKFWTIARQNAEHEIETQREALKQAEAVAAARIAEAEAFSDAQAKKIEELESYINEQNYIYNNSVRELKDEIEKQKTLNEQLHAAQIERDRELMEHITDLKQKNATLEERLAGKINQEKFNNKKIADLEDEKKDLVKKIETQSNENNRLEMQIHKQQLSLDTITQERDNEKAKKNELHKDREKWRTEAAILEGELKAWKELKPKNETRKKPVKNSADEATPEKK